MNECTIDLDIKNTDLNILNEMRIYSKVFTEKVTKSQWKIHIAEKTKNDNKWLGIWLKLLYKPEAIQAIATNHCFQINDMNQQNIHSMISMGIGNNRSIMDLLRGHSEFIPLKVVENWKQINIQCWVAVDCIEISWISDLSLSR